MTIMTVARSEDLDLLTHGPWGPSMETMLTHSSAEGVRDAERELWSVTFNARWD